jgi:transcriptional regulator
MNENYYLRRSTRRARWTVAIWVSRSSRRGSGYLQDAVNRVTKTGRCNVAIINKVAKKMHDPERKR